MLQSLFLDIWAMTTEMAPYLLLGFLLAGLMHAFIPRHIYSQYLSQPNFRSVLLAALFGVPLPLCSCGVLPTAMGLRREGGSKGATVSFLIATPQTGIDSIIATYSLMGLSFAIIRPIVAFVTAIFGGALVNRFEPQSTLSANEKNKTKVEECSCTTQCSESESFPKRLRSALSYGYVEMMADIGKWLVIGLIVAGMITALVPDAWFEVFKDNSMLSILLVLTISVPMYVCATGSIPIAVALMLKGLTPGAALVLLMAGPACNVASLLVINKVMGRRTLLLYLLSIVGGAIGFGLGIDYLLPRHWFTLGLSMQEGCCTTEELGIFSILCAVLLIVLLINALFHHHEEEVCEISDLGTTSNVFHIEGMNCSHCAANVERAIRNIEGVKDVTVSLSENKAIVSGEIDEKLIYSAVESLGFKIK